MTLNFYANVIFFFFLRYIFRSNDTNMFIFISLGNGILWRINIFIIKRWKMVYLWQDPIWSNTCYTYYVMHCIKIYLKKKKKKNKKKFETIKFTYNKFIDILLQILHVTLHFESYTMLNWIFELVFSRIKIRYPII